MRLVWAMATLWRTALVHSPLSYSATSHAWGVGRGSLHHHHPLSPSSPDPAVSQGSFGKFSDSWIPLPQTRRHGPALSEEDAEDLAAAA